MSSVITILTEGSMIIGFVILILLFNPQLSIIIISITTLIVASYYFFIRKKVNIWGKRRQEHDALKLKNLYQSLENIKIIKFLGLENFFKKKFYHHNSIATDMTNKINTKYSSPMFGTFDRKILDDVFFKIKKNEFVGIIGESGSGKTTFLNIFLTLLNFDSGEYLVDKKKISRENNIFWRSRISFVPQEPYLIDDTLIKNVAFGIEDDLINIDQVKMCLIQLNLI